jgi:hemerythrin
MPVITWSDKYSVQVPAMDEQHKRLINLINQLYDAMKAGEAQTVIKPILDSLASYTVTHFKAEEKALEQVKYPMLHEQKTEHELFVTKLNDMKKKAAVNHASLTFELVGFLKDWLINHIQGKDQKYSSYFAKQRA